MPVNYKLLDLTADNLLEKFGAGSHKPGSGSAAALDGILAAQLVITVATLTLERDTYKKWHPKLAEIISDLKNTVVPKLKELFEADSVVFGKVITARLKRDAERDPNVRAKLAEESRQLLIPATEIPLEIGELCIRVCRSASFTFEHGFKAARGDSSVALSGGIAAMVGCIAIVNVNILAYGQDNWTAKILQKEATLNDISSTLKANSDKLVKNLRQEIEKDFECQQAINRLLSWKGNRNFGEKDIEQIARAVQNTLWKHRETLWKNKVWSVADINEQLAVLKPKVALKALGYYVTDSDVIGPYISQGKSIDIAGIIDDSTKRVLISSDYPSETRLFTMAHELGHAVLHNYSVMHRDIPMDGSAGSKSRFGMEWQADRFASCFLMPKAKVVEILHLHFLCDRFIISPASALGFGFRSISAFQSQFNNRRKLSRKIATAGSFNGEVFMPLNKIFSVSAETMSIRLEELGLV